jgi:diadenosine tetraphosphate (Ap4A) HIT family hydrolase
MDLLPGHTLVVPKVHYADVYSIPDDALASLISSCKKHALRWRERHSRGASMSRAPTVAT